MEEPLLLAGDPGPPEGVLPQDHAQILPEGNAEGAGEGMANQNENDVPLGRNQDADHVGRPAQRPNPSPAPKFTFLGKYFSVSLGLALSMTYFSLATYEQFYPALEYLGTSRVSLFILGNLGFACSLVGYKVVVRIFLGTLRDYEVERVQDRIGQAIIETLLAMTIFRHNMETLGFIARFVLLAFVKMFHWLAQDRVDFIETTTNTTRVQHLRLVSMIVWLAVVDVCLLHNALASVFKVGVSAHLLFAFEYSMQTTLALAVLFKYMFSLIDMRCNGAWRGKSVAVFYVDLTRDLVHLITYSAFFFVVFSSYGIPIHLMRDIYWTFSNFTARVRAFLRFRQISSNMEDRFPTATEADLDRGDRMCIVCREDMEVEMAPKRLPCGHCFHLDCLKSWLERQQNCPICRRLIPAEEEAVSGDVPVGGVAAGEGRMQDQNIGENAGGQVDGARDRNDDRTEAAQVAPEIRQTRENRESQQMEGIRGSQDGMDGAGVQESRDRTLEASRPIPDREAFLRRLERQEEDRANERTGDETEASTSGGLKSELDASEAPDTSQRADLASGVAEGPDHPTRPEGTNITETEERFVQSQPRSHPIPSTSPPEPVQNESSPSPPPVLLFPVPGTLLFDMPDFDEDPNIGDTLRAAASRDLDLHPTDEQHERALAIARASAHAAAIAAATTEL